MNQKKLLERLTTLADEATILEVDMTTGRVVLQFMDDALEAMLKKLVDATASQEVLAAVRREGLPAGVMSEIRSGQKIAAIKLWRERFGTSLVDAKNAIEALAAGQVGSQP